MFENKQRNCSQLIFSTNNRSRAPNTNSSSISQLPAAGDESYAKDDDNYYEISDFGARRKESSSNYAKPDGKHSSSPVRPPVTQHQRRHHPHVPTAAAAAQQEFVPAFPVTQPPLRPPGSANSSQTGGYYSSGSSLGAPSSYASHNQSSLPRSPGHRGSLVGKHSMSSRAVSFEDEDDGFYDNIQVAFFQTMH
ncbi:unnamed protein product [Gongylonema pulchrum]|uniref:ZM domain-containing protein n=1 Tax=Gongylonema pulchrum TaxID=637853 RepID=A0A183DBX1_9BILA|nr:unnamed protein product [Gongylonema pulchrum]